MTDAPAGLSGNALRLWTDTTAEYDLATHELFTLEQACRELDLIDRMQREIDQLEEFEVMGSKGQPVVSELIREIRQHRSEFTRLIRALNLPQEDGSSNRSTAARAAANARWRRAS